MADIMSTGQYIYIARAKIERYSKSVCSESFLR